MGELRGTTIVAVRRDGRCAVAGDGQVTLGESTVLKHSATKVRRIYKDKVVVGFAGSVADAFTLSERFEAKLEQYSGSLERANWKLCSLRQMKGNCCWSRERAKSSNRMMECWQSARAVLMPMPLLRPFMKIQNWRQEKLRTKRSRLLPVFVSLPMITLR